MHKKLDLSLLAGSYEMLIIFCCQTCEPHLALDVLNEMGQAGFTVSVEALNSVCHTCENTREYILVRRIYSMISRYKLQPDSEIYRRTVNMNVRLNDFDNAYAMLDDLDRLNLSHTASIYNAILGGYVRQENMNGVKSVLKTMKEVGVKPDSHTFSLLIRSCTHEEDIAKVLSVIVLWLKQLSIVTFIWCFTL